MLIRVQIWKEESVPIRVYYARAAPSPHSNRADWCLLNGREALIEVIELANHGLVVDPRGR